MTAWLLREQGHTVIGLTMQVWDGAEDAEACHGRTGCYGPGELHDLAAVRRLSERLGIEHHVINLADTYRREVLAYFSAEYRAGRTPNPCVRCNRAVKFGALLDEARRQGLAFDRFATGHYARRVEAADGRIHLLRGADPAKDQSYFLARLRQPQLRAAWFPLGGYTKVAVRALARRLGWHELADKAESQDFADGGDYRGLLDADANTPGDIVTLDGRVIGRHEGLTHYTVGQRKGLRLGGLDEPLYVVRLDAAANTVVVGPRPALLGTELVAADLNWIAQAAPPAGPVSIAAQIRQRHAAAAATLTLQSDGRARVRFDAPQTAITPGQAVVFYRGDDVLGSGIIEPG